MSEIKKHKGEKIKKFLETDDPFVDYVLEDVWIRARVGKGAVRARKSDSETLEIIGMDEKAISDVEGLLQKGKFRLNIKKLRRPTKEELEKWLTEEKGKKYPMLPFDEI